MLRRLRPALVRATFLSILILSLITFSASTNAQQTSNPVSQSVSPRPNDDSIVLTVTVNNKKGSYIRGLDKSAFAIYENKTPQEITYFAANDESASIGILFDLSGSVLERGSEQLAVARNAFLRFMKTSHSENEYFVISFANQARLLVDWTRSSEAIAKGLSKMEVAFKTGANTAFYDACYLGIEKMSSSSYPKQVLLVISDGQDNKSRYTFREVRERLKESRTLFYSVGISPVNDTGSFLGLEGGSVLNELSFISGGMGLYPVNQKQIDASFDLIATELRLHYLLGFKPPNDEVGGNWHKVKIKVTAPPRMSDLSARAREGYYSRKNLR